MFSHIILWISQCKIRIDLLLNAYLQQEMLQKFLTLCHQQDSSVDVFPKATVSSTSNVLPRRVLAALLLLCLETGPGRKSCPDLAVALRGEGQIGADWGEIQVSGCGDHSHLSFGCVPVMI